MQNRTRIYYFSHLVLFITGTFYILDLMTGSRLSYLLSLNSAMVYNDLQWWRLITYPLATDSIESTALFLFAFFIFAPKIETLFSSWFFPLVLLIIIFLQGALFTLLLHYSYIVFTGMEGISFFILTVFALANIKKKLVIMNKVFLRTGLFIFGLITIWFVLLFVHSVVIADYKIFFEGMYSGIFGLTSGIIIYLQIRYTKRILPFEKHGNHSTDRIFYSNDKELSMAVIANNEIRKFNENLRDELVYGNNQFNYTEEKLNEILDKISAKGKDSLTYNEQKFLEDFSKQI